MDIKLQVTERIILHGFGTKPGNTVYIVKIPVESRRLPFLLNVSYCKIETVKNVVTLSLILKQASNLQKALFPVSFKT